ncbi:hypothetical protein NDI49_25975 [Trichocoleus sp. ST-U3]
MSLKRPVSGMAWHLTKKRHYSLYLCTKKPSRYLCHETSLTPSFWDKGAKARHEQVHQTTRQPDFLGI